VKSFALEPIEKASLDELKALIASTRSGK